jgi:hypothetical protein
MRPYSAKNGGMAMKKSLLIFAVAVGFLMIPGVLSAHHAQSWSDNQHPITLTGTVQEFLFSNPHCQLFFETKGADGKLEHWVVEVGAPHGLHRAGWTSATIKPGDSITITGGPAKDGRKMINIFSGKLIINGKELSTSAAGEPTN